MAKKKPRHTRKTDLLLRLQRPIAITAVSVTLIGFAVAGHSVPTKHTEAPAEKVIAIPAPAPRQQSTPETTASTATSGDTTSTTPTTTTSKPTVTASIPQGTKPEPVVTPSPSSSVSSLAPVTTTTPSGGSSNTSGGSSTTQSNPTPPTTTGYTSANWSGYMATTGSFTAISGAWTIPNVTGPSGETSADSAWIGIGGVSSNDLIQVGTQDTVNSTGKSSSSAFYELLPNSSITIPTITVSAGDHMTASLLETSSGEWTITITDTTNGQSYTRSVAYASSNSSAEWIEEDPSYSFRREIPFDNFGSVTFTGGTTIMNGASVSIGSSSAQPVTMLNSSSTPVATPSGLSGSTFSVTRNE